MAEVKFKRQFSFIPNSRYFIALSALFVICSIAAIWKIGINKGIDFVGGIKLTVRIGDNQAHSAGEGGRAPSSDGAPGRMTGRAPVTDGAVADALRNAGIDGSVQRLGNPADHRFLIKLRASETGEETQSTIDGTTNALTSVFGADSVAVEGQESVGPRVGRELMRKGQAAILFTLIAMLVYIWFRFDFFFAPGAIIALFHDVIITMGFLVIAHREYDLTILAAILTIVGYSINDTIIIYDRIREHGREITEDTVAEVVNRAINDTLSRTIVTSLTVLFVVVILFFTTQGVIQNFAYSFIVGVIAGSYSTIFIASPVYIWLYKRFPQWRKA